ncbi:MAG TPA: hypothetical protein VOB72_13955 [Candidatus Dormibacteraeota bacterium]|nr:hypothetical protein [Candidatus Dormibacteraeota bacterium]
MEWRNRLGLERDASSAIYGTIITASTMVGVAEGVHDLGPIVATVVVTLVVYALAHAYCKVLGGPADVPSWGAFARELGAESPMLSACVLPLLVLVAFSLLGSSLNVAVMAALLSAVGMLFLWGIVAARRARQGALPQLLSATVLGLLGLAIVVLRTTTAH